MNLETANRAERKDAVRRVVLRLLAESRTSHAELARRLGVSETQLERMLKEGGERSIPLSDLVPLECALPGVLAELAAACRGPDAPTGYRVVPADRPVGRREVIEALSKHERCAALTCSTVLDAIADGTITPRELAETRRALREERAAIATLEASVGSASS